MNCATCDKEIDAYPCVCGAGEAMQEHGKTLPPVHSYVPLQGGPYLTKEEFGLNLYDTIKTISGLMGIDAQRAGAIHRHHGYQLQRLNARRQDLQKTLATQLPVLTEHEMAQVLARYPQVTGY